MAEYVIKDDGLKEPFQAEKIRGSIREAAQEAGLPEERVAELVEEVGEETVEMTEQRDTIPTREIRDFILEELGEEAPSVAGAWKRHEERKEE